MRDKKTLHRLNAGGSLHVIVPLLVVLAVASVGAFLEVKSHAATPAPSPSGLHVQAAINAATAASVKGTKVGFSIYNGNGNSPGSYNGTFQNYGASITKSMILVAYLNQVGGGTISSSVKTNLQNMIEVSDNTSANNVYKLLKNPQTTITALAHNAGMKGFVFNNTDTTYVLGQSKVTANDFAKFFSNIFKSTILSTKVSTVNRNYGLGLLTHISAGDQKGLLRSGLPGTVYSKEGWKPESAGLEGAPYVVNQVARFNTKDGGVWGVAVTVSGVGTTAGQNNGVDEAAGEAIVQKVVSALL